VRAGRDEYLRTTVSRQKELAVRLALGASANRVLQQGLIESVVLALLGCASGLVLAVGGMRLLVDFAPALPVASDVAVDGRVLTYAIIIALATGVAFGLLPTVRALKVRASDVLKETATRNAGSAGQSSARTVLSVAEVALAAVLMIGAGLLIRSFVGVRSVDVGFDPQRLVIAILSAPPAASSDPDRVIAFFQDVIARAEQVPGVARVAGASAVPFISNESSPFRVEAALPSTDGEVYAEQPKITPECFRAMGIRLLTGREFDRTDVQMSEPVAIVSKGLADAYWPGEEVIGKRIQIDDRQWRRIVGVADDVRHDGFDQPVRPTIYIPFAQYPRSTMTLLIRSNSDPLSIVSSIRESVRSVDRNQPLFGIQTMEQTLSASLSTRRFLVILAVIFAGVAVVLGTVGVYGVLSYLVGQRRQELAIRAALGAKSSEVIRLVVRHGVVLASIGVGFGLLGSVALSRVVSGLLFGVNPTDPWTFASVPILLIGIVSTASYVSARGAARVDAASVLRGE